MGVENLEEGKGGCDRFMNDYTEMSVLDMRLPKGKICGDCIYYAKCKGLFGCKVSNEVCDWCPSRFVEDSGREREC
jgi:hypothetical protein